MKLRNRLTVRIGCIVLLAAMTLVVDTRAAEPVVSAAHPEHRSSVDVAEQATDPSAVLTQLGFFYWNTRNEDGDVISQTTLFQPVLPLSRRNVFRPALPLITTAGRDGETGIGDLLLLDIFLHQVSSGTWGIGPVASLPTASEDAFGSGKYALGIAGTYMYKGMPKNLFGIIGYSLNSVAGKSDRDDVSKLSFQPIWVRNYDWGYIGWTDLNASFDWENDSKLSFPIGLRFGNVYTGSTPMNLAIQPYYTLNDSKEDEYGVKLQVTFVKPSWLRH